MTGWCGGTPKDIVSTIPIWVKVVPLVTVTLDFHEKGWLILWQARRHDALGFLEESYQPIRGDANAVGAFRGIRILVV